MKIIMKPVRVKDLYTKRQLDKFTEYEKRRMNYFVRDITLTGSVYKSQGKSYTPHLTKDDLINKLSSKLGIERSEVIKKYSDKIDKSYLIHLDNYIKAYIVDRGILHYSVNGHYGNRCSSLIPDFNNRKFDNNKLKYDRLIFVTDEHYAFIPIPYDEYQPIRDMSYQERWENGVYETIFDHDGNYEDMYKRMVEIGKIEVEFYDKDNNLSTKTIHIKDFRIKQPEEINNTKWNVDSDGNKYYNYKK